MATHNKTISLTDLQQKILSNDLYNDTDNVGIDTTLGNIHTYFGNHGSPNGITCDNPLLWTNESSIKQKFPIDFFRQIPN